MPKAPSERMKTLAEFYPYYLQEHRKGSTRLLHFIGTTGFLAAVIGAIFWGNGRILAGGIVCAYAFAWIGHFFFEKNRPATFKYPLLSLISDFKLYFEIWTGRQKLFP
jgi:hypothetical protein